MDCLLESLDAEYSCGSHRSLNGFHESRSIYTNNCSHPHHPTMSSPSTPPPHNLHSPQNSSSNSQTDSPTRMDDHPGTPPSRRSSSFMIHDILQQSKNDDIKHSAPLQFRSISSELESSMVPFQLASLPTEYSSTHNGGPIDQLSLMEGYITRMMLKQNLFVPKVETW